MTSDQQKEIKKLFVDKGVSILGISKRLSVPYSTIYSFLMRNRLIEKNPAFKGKDGERFNYKEYMEEVKKRCKKDLGMTDKQFNKFLNTKEGEGRLIKETEYFTPQIFLDTKK